MKLQFSPEAAALLHDRFVTLANVQHEQVRQMNDRIEEARGVVQRLEELRDEDYRKATDLDLIVDTNFVGPTEIDENDVALDQIDRELLLLTIPSNEALHAELIAFRKARQGIVDEEPAVVEQVFSPDE